MKIAVLGTGMVGRAHAAKLSELGHQVMIGTRDVHESLAKAESGRMAEPFGEWAEKHPKVRVANFADAAKHGEIIFEALSGQVAVKTLAQLKPDLDGKILIEVANPLDFSSGELKLTVCNDDSLGEQIQKTLPGTKVVKAFNTMNASVQTDPASVAGGGHHLFVAGEDKSAKQRVADIAGDWYGWKNIIDLGGIKSARGMEMILPIWLNLSGVMGTAKINFKIAK
jgi:NADPH-dependent F420 reductase